MSCWFLFASAVWEEGERPPQVLRSLRGQSRANLSSVLQSEEQTASGVPGAIRRMWFGDGQSVLRMVTDQLGKKSGLSSCFLRGVPFFLILTSALPFLANVTDLPPLIGSQGFPFWAYHPLFLPGLWPEKIRPYRSWIRPWK